MNYIYIYIYICVCVCVCPSVCLREGVRVCVCVCVCNIAANMNILVFFILCFFHIQVFGFNSQLYSNFSEALHRAQGIVAMSLLLQVSSCLLIYNEKS